MTSRLRLPCYGCGGCGIPSAYAPSHLRNTDCTGANRRSAAAAAARRLTCCAPSVAVYAAPVAQWSGGCGGCGAPVGYGGYGGGDSGCGNCGVTAVYTTPAPLYVVNQGPDFEGPGVFVPYHSYAPPAEYAPAPDYPPYAGGLRRRLRWRIWRWLWPPRPSPRRLWRGLLPSAHDGAALLRRTAHDASPILARLVRADCRYTKCEGPRRAGLRAFWG